MLHRLVKRTLLDLVFKLAVMKVGKLGGVFRVGELILGQVADILACVPELPFSRGVGAIDDKR